MIKPIGLSIGDLQRKYGDIKALEIAANAGADSVDFDLCADRNDYRNKDSLYSKGFQEVLGDWENGKTGRFGRKIQAEEKRHK